MRSGAVPRVAMTCRVLVFAAAAVAARTTARTQATAPAKTARVDRQRPSLTALPSETRGRTAIHELLDLSEHIREMILDKRPASEIKRVAREEGMTFLRESALEKARIGVTTLKEINKVTFIEG